MKEESRPKDLQRADLLEPVFFEDRPDVSEDERYQNTVLRPILKFQHASLCLVTVEAMRSLNPGFIDLPERKQKQFITTALTSNLALRNQLLGLVLGMLDEIQLIIFLSNKKEYSKRVQAMVLQRVMEGYKKFL